MVEQIESGIESGERTGLFTRRGPGRPRQSDKLSTDAGGITKIDARRQPWSDERRAAHARPKTGSGAAEALSEGLEISSKSGTRPPKPRPPAVVTPENIDQFGELIFIGHAMLAGAAKLPALNASKLECHELSRASLNVMRHYATFGVNEKLKDWALLFVAISMIEGPKFSAFTAAKKSEREIKKQPVAEPMNVLRQAEPPPGPVFIDGEAISA